jgi:hypothetical protein
MFVESMTFEEMRKEYDKDMPSIKRKLAGHSDDVVKQMRKTNMKTFYKEYSWVSPLKNRWTYIFNFNLDLNKNPKTFPLYCVFFTEKSYSVLSAAGDHILAYFTSHFFTRYIEREGLQRYDIHEAVKTYMKRNPGLVIQKEKHLFDDRWSVFVQHKEGVAFGTEYEKLQFVEMRTFITNDMLKGNQIDLSKKLDEQFHIGTIRKNQEEK